MIELVLYFWTASDSVVSDDHDLRWAFKTEIITIITMPEQRNTIIISGKRCQLYLQRSIRNSYCMTWLFMFKGTNSHFDTARDVFVAQHDLVQLKATTPGCFIRQHVFLLLRDTHKSAYYWYRFVFRKLIFMLPSSHFVLRRNIFIRAKAEIST